MDIIQTIKKRKSIRTFQNQQISQDILNKIENFIDESIPTPNGNTIDTQIIEKHTGKKKRKLGTYGIIKNGQYFLVGTVEDTSQPNFVDFGFSLERAVLYLTNLNLGSCWLGGSFSNKNFRNVTETSEDETIPAVIVFGLPKDKRSLRDKFLAFSANSANRKPWKDIFFKEDPETPLTKEQASDYRKPLEMLRLAPSASNKQPWRVIKEDNIIHFFAKKNAIYSNFLQDVDLQSIDMGIGFYHFQATAEQLDLTGEWKHIENDFNTDWNYILSWKTT